MHMGSARGFLPPQVTEMEFRLNYEVLRNYITFVVTPDRLPGLSDHKDACVAHNLFLGAFGDSSSTPDVWAQVAFMHLSCQHNLHPDVRHRGNKTKVKDCWTFIGHVCVHVPACYEMLCVWCVPAPL